MRALTISEVVDRVRQLPALPAIVLELMRLLDDENVDIAAIAAKISRDQSMSAKLLRLANSSFYGLSGQIMTIHDATMVLGLRSVRTLTIASSMMAGLRAPGSGSVDAQIFWRHCLATAMCARSFAAHCDQDPDAAFIAGLLHDIGKQVLVVHFPEAWAAVMVHRSKFDCEAADAEREVLGFDHAAIGAELAGRWRFPAAVRDAIAGHHDSTSTGASALADLIHIADGVAHALDLSGDPNEMVPQLSPSAWDRLGLSWASLQPAFAGIEREHRSVAMALA